MKKLIKRIYYNGGMEMLIFTIFFAVIVVLFLLAHLLVCAALALLLYALIYLDIYFFRSYRGKVFEDSVFIKRNLNQRTSIKINADECIIDVFHDELIDYLNKYVIDYGYVCLCSTHEHVIRHIEKVLGDKVKIIYNKDNYSIKDLKNLKKSFIKSCRKCSYCDKQDSCKLFCPKTTRMYNVKIQRRD